MIQRRPRPRLRLRQRPRRLVAAVATFALALAGLTVLAAPASAGTTRAFTPVFTTNTTGDVTIRGNTLETCLAGSTQAQGTVTCASAQGGVSQQNNNYFMTYVDIDGSTGIGASTFDSSSATVTVPSGATVLYAGLSWGATTGAGALTGYPALTGVAAPNASAKDTALFAAPGATSYSTVTSSTTDVNSVNYQAYADVTSAVQAGGSGVYTLANVQAGTGGGNYAGWSLAVAYSDPTMPSRNLTVFTGYNQVSSSGSSTLDIPVSGFTTPSTGQVRTTVGVVAYEGDKGSTGDSMSIGSTALSNSLNPVNDVFNSSITDLNVAVTNRYPSYPNTLGFDVDRFDATGALTNGATSTTIHLTTSGDTYYPGMLTFATDLYASALSATKTVTDVNGGSVNRGDVLSYSITVSNSGVDGAAATVLSDAVPVNTTYVAGSLAIDGTSVTDASGDDTGDASAGNITARLGTGATATSGGLLVSAATTTVTFRVTVSSSVADGTSISNTATFTSNNQTTGVATGGGSNTVTSAVVVPPSLSGTLTSPGEVGAAYSSGLTLGSGTGTGPYVYSISVGTLPAGLSINSSTGLITGTPTTAGTSSFTVLVTDANSRTATRAQSITIGAGPVVAFTPPSGEVSVAYSAQPTVSSGTSPYTWSVSSGTLPAGLTISSSTGLISGTPTTAGTTSITVQATDANSVSATSTASIVIVSGPSLTFAAPPAGTLSAAYSDQLTYTGGVGPYTWSVSTGSLPAGLTLGSSTGLLSGTPTAAGSSTFTVRIVDANGLVDTASTTLVIARITPTISLSAPSSVNFGTSLTLSSSVGPSAAGGTVTFTDVPVTGPQTGTTVTLGSATLSAGSASVNLALPAFGVNTITATYSGNGSYAPASSSTALVEVSAYAGEIIITEFRTSGPAGSGDSYVELKNTGAPVPLAGIVVSSGTGVTSTLPSNAGILGTGRSYLITGSAYSLGAVATSDYSTTTVGRSGFQVVAPDSASTQTDAVGPTSSSLHLGTGLSAMSGSPTAQWAWVRREQAGAQVDTRNNAADFVLVSKNLALVGGLQPTLGSASPTGTADPFQHNSGLTSTLLDPAVAASAAPNRVVVSGSPGTLVIRRTITNTSGATITAAKVRVSALSELYGPARPGGSPSGSIADLRVINPSVSTESVQVSGGGFVTVNDLSVDAPITSATGGGLNSTLTLPLPNGGLANGASINVAFTMAVDTHGTFWFGYDVDAR